LSTSRQENAKQVFCKVLTYFILACSSVFLLLSFFIDEIVRFELFGFTIFGEEYWESTAIVPLILLSYIFYGIYVNFLVGVYIKKKTAMLPLITGIAALVNIGANLMLIPFWGMMGSAWAKVICYATMAVLLYYKIHRLYYIKYEWKKIYHLAAVTLGIFLMQNYIFQFEWWWQKLALLFVWAFILVFSGFLDQTERSYIRNLPKKINKNVND
jgi:O-antigen/teichoic acid export membrane protein